MICGTWHGSLASSMVPCVRGLEGYSPPFPDALAARGVRVPPRLCQRGVLWERVGGQKGGGGHSSCGVVADGYDLADMSFCNSRTLCSFHFIVTSLMGVQLGCLTTISC